MKKTLRWLGVVAVAAAALALVLPALPQNPQTQTAPIFSANAKYTNGTAPGYWPTQLSISNGSGGTIAAATGLNINLGPGTVNCGSGSVVTYNGGTFALTASATNRIYLNTASSCAPSVKTTAFVSADIPIAVIVTSGSAITSISDVRTQFAVPSTPGTSVTLQTNGVNNADQTVLNIFGGGINPRNISSGNVLLGAAGSLMNPNCFVGIGGLIGAFTDSSGNVVQPICIGNGPIGLLVPTGATQLQFGVNDDQYFNNLGSFVISTAVNAGSSSNSTVLGTAMPWNPSTNPSYSFGINDGTSPLVARSGLTAGQTITIQYISGTVAISGAVSFFDANGNMAFMTGGFNTGITSTFFPTKYMNAANLIGVNGVSSWSGDGTIFGNSSSVGSVIATLISQAPNRFLAGPVSGGSANPTFRTLISADIPNNAANTSGTAAKATDLASYPTLCSGSQFSQGLSSGSNNCATPSGGGTTISGLTFAATATTIVASWTTSSAADSNLYCGGKPAIDNGFQQGLTSGHLAIVTGLNPSSSYSCYVVSAGTASTPSSVSTSASATRTPIRSATLGTVNSWTTTGVGDNQYNVVSSDGLTYSVLDDTTANSLNANQAIVKFTNETNMTVSTVNAMSGFGAQSTFNGTDGPGKTGMSNKLWGLWSQSGGLCAWEGRLAQNWPQSSWYPWLMCDHGDHGATWNTFQAPATYTSTGTEIQGAGMFPYPAIGPVTFVQYAADDGTVGYTTTGNGIDGANGWVYMNFNDGWWNGGNYLFLMRVPRVYLTAQAAWTRYQFWKGPQNPTPGDFNSDDNWSYSFDSKQPILSGFGTIGAVNEVFVPGFNYYVLNVSMAGGASGFLGLPSGNVWTSYAAPTPAGPFMQIYSNTWSTGTAYYDQVFLMRPIQANASAASLTAPLLWSAQNIASMFYGNFTMSSQPALTLTSFCGGGLGGTVSTTFSIATNSSCSGSMNVAQGSSLLVLVLADTSPNDAAVATRVFDTAGNTFLPISVPLGAPGGSSGPKFRGSWYLCNNCNGNSADVISAVAQFAGTTPFSTISVWQIAAGPVQGDGNILTALTVSGTSVATTAFNTSFTNEICVAVGSENGSATVGTAGSGFTLSSSSIYGTQFTAEHAIFSLTQTGLAPSMTWGSSGLLSIWEACVGH